MKEKLRKREGITLIALVITIVVLLILAGISIAMITGDNGILTQAQKAKTETEDSREDELRRLTALEAATNLENTTFIDNSTGEEVPVTIPAGFAISQVKGENTVKDGLVIIDSKGNEFVFIPVTNADQYIRETTYAHINTSEAAYTDTGYLPDVIQPSIDDSINNENAERKAVISKGGFYISRYEAGKEGESTLVSKKGATVWTNISQADCKKVAKTFINNKNVKSALCSGIQWDMTMKFVDGKNDGSDDENKTFDVTQSKESRHTGLLAASGQNNDDKVCNIYDLEGNCLEYIAENNSYSPRGIYVYRGSSYRGNGAASYRYGSDGSAEYYPGLAFRFVLYVM